MSLKNVFNHNSNSQLNTILSKTEKQFSVRYGIQRFINVDICYRDRLCVTVAYIDFNKEFDSVSHTKLFSPFAQFGIHGELLLWLKKFSVTV